MAFITAAAVGAGLYGGWKSGQAKKKAAQKQLDYMKKALQLGTIDAYGNKLSADSNGVLSYDLTNATKQARTGAEKAMYALGNYNDKSGRQIANETMLANTIANNKAAQANQNAAMKQALRTSSNLGSISAGFANQNSKNLRNAYLQGQHQALNAPQYNANMRNTLAQAAANAQQPLGNIQNNLQNQRKTQMMQLNNIAQAQNDPYLHGQTTADIANTFSQGLGAYSKYQQKKKLLDLENANYDKLIQALAEKLGG